MGDDQHRSGYEPTLDAWLAQLWPALRAAFPLPAGFSEPAPTDTATELVCKYRVAWLSSEEVAAAQAAAAQSSGAAHESSCAWGAHAEALSAAAQFDRVEAAASGLPPALQQQGPEGQPSARAAGGPATTAGHGSAGSTGAASYGPHRPYWARLTANKRITAPAHFQDVSGWLRRDALLPGVWAATACGGRPDSVAGCPSIRGSQQWQPAAQTCPSGALSRMWLRPCPLPAQVRLLDIDLAQSGISYEPGDVLAMVPQQPLAAVEALCRRCGWDPHAWVRVEPVLTPAAAAAAGEPGSPAAAAADGGEANGSSAAPCSCTVRLGALVAGALDVNGASPRRFFFQAGGSRQLLCSAAVLSSRWRWDAPLHNTLPTRDHLIRLWFLPPLPPPTPARLGCPQVLHQFVRGSELEEERLAYFSSPEGRDDLYEYNQREGMAGAGSFREEVQRHVLCACMKMRCTATPPDQQELPWPQPSCPCLLHCAGRTVLEVLNDFKSACLPLEWLLQVR